MHSIVAQWQRIHYEKRKLLLSLCINILTRIPGSVGVLWFLPRLRFGLGVAAYSELLSAIAFAFAIGFCADGLNVIARRQIGEAYGDRQQHSEADSFVSLIAAQAIIFLVSVLVVSTYWYVHGGSRSALIVSIMTVAGAFLNQFCDVRAAYNEHYVTAISLVILQTLGYLVGFLVPSTQHSMILGSLVLLAAYMLSNLLTLLLLIWQRPYLLRGKPFLFWFILRRGIMLAIADGLLIATLSLSVVWIQAEADAGSSAWFATCVRLFQIFLAPVVLLLLPLSGYYRMLWKTKSFKQQSYITKLTCLLGISYGGFVAISLFMLSTFYVGSVLRIPAPSNIMHVVPVFALFGAIVAYKAYSSLAYVTAERITGLSMSTTLASVTAVAFGFAASFMVAPLNALSVYALTGSFLMLIVLLENALHLTRLLPKVVDSNLEPL